MNITQLLYYSKATPLINEENLPRILTHAKKKNFDANITGFLAHNSLGEFMQVIEGPTDVVNLLFSVIKADCRHVDVRLLSTEEVYTRSFPDWSMAYESTSATTLERSVPGFVSRDADVALAVRLRHAPAHIKTALRKFMNK